MYEGDSVMLRISKITFCILICMGMFSACSDSDGENTKAEAIPVDVSIVKLGNVSQLLTYSGDIHAEYEVKVFSKIPDRIEKFYADEGDPVKKGQVIARITATTIEQGVRQAEAALAAARAQEANLNLEFDRAKRLFGENAMSKQQYDAIQTQYEAAKAQAEQAKAGLISVKSQLRDAELTAPIGGIIGQRFYEEGDMASAGMPVVSIVQMEKVKIVFDATEEDLGKLALGQQATIKVRSYTDQAFLGTVQKISPVLDPLTRMAKVEVLIDNPDYLLKPGMYAEVSVTTGLLSDVIVVPRYVSIESTTLEKIDGEDQVQKNYYVYTVEKGCAKQKKLDVRYVNHKSIAVNGGVVVGDTLVVAGQNNLRDGLNVSIVKFEGNVL
ncbi:MAG TPA: efflux RND transporter periplasmic adaptor subunit [Caldithrix sp.]|nr:efflux RND transporter periplasmic adaptor subunit [Caldithrix sp.]